MRAERLAAQGRAVAGDAGRARAGEPARRRRTGDVPAPAGLRRDHHARRRGRRGEEDRERRRARRVSRRRLGQAATRALDEIATNGENLRGLVARRRCGRALTGARPAARPRRTLRRAGGARRHSAACDAGAWRSASRTNRASTSSCTALRIAIIPRRGNPRPSSASASRLLDRMAALYGAHERLRRLFGTKVVAHAGAALEPHRRGSRPSASVKSGLRRSRPSSGAAPARRRRACCR